MRFTATLSALRTEYVAAALAAVIALGVCGAIGAWALHERERAIQDQGYRTAANLAAVLEQQVVGAVQAVDLTLLHTVDTMRLLPRLPDHDPAFEESLREKLPRLPYVRSLFVAGPDGSVIQDTDHPFTAETDFAKCDCFTAQIENPSLGLYVGQPILGPSNTWLVSVSRRISGPGGGFAGVVVATIEVQRFASIYRSLGLEPSTSIALFRRDGTLLFRVPYKDSLMGQRMTGKRLFQIHLASNPIGSYRSEASLDGTPRMIGYRAIEEYPLVVGVAIAEEAVLAPWRHNVLSAAIGGLMLTILLSIAGIAAVRYRRRFELARLRQLQTQHLETLGRMTGGIAHDVNNLLAIIASGTRILTRSDGASAERTRMVAAELTEAVARGRALMTQLLSFAKSHALDIQPVRIGSRMENLRPLLRQAVGRNVTVTFEVARDIWACRADPVQFDAALLNLAVNARDAMPAGGQLTVTARNLDLRAGTAAFHVPAGEYVEICVTDTGAGMSQDVLRQALEPFFSTKGDAGTGLGLPQVYGFARQVGGDLTIESTVGKGTTIRLLFPRAADPAPDARMTGESRAASAGDKEIRIAEFGVKPLHATSSTARAPEKTTHP